MLRSSCWQILPVSLIILLFTSSNFLFAQEYGRLRGFLTDSTSGEALAFGNVYIRDINIGASTDERGLYLINKIPIDKTYEVTYSYVGYRTKVVSVYIENSNIVDLNVSLTPLNIELQTIEKMGEKVVEENATDISVEKIPIKQLEVLPSDVEPDIFKYVQNSPGVSTTGDISAKFYVRGGNSDQNLFLLNGVPLYTPYHSLGFSSSFG